MRNDPILSLNQVIIYLRKSRADDPNMSVEDVLASHERQLQEYATKTFGSVIPESQIYREVVSGETISDRPVVQQVLRLIESEDIRAVLVIEPQRLSRGDLENCGRIINLFRYSQTYVLTPMVSYDLCDEYDRKFFEMELTRGNDYLEYTKRILLRGRLAAVKQGDYIGNVAPYGYRKAVIADGKKRHHTLEIVPEEADAVKIMFAMYADGTGFPTIAHHLDDLGIIPRNGDHWKVATLKDMLENPVYIGKIRWNWKKTRKVVEDGEIRKIRRRDENCLLFDGLHPAIIDKDLYDRANAIRKSRPHVRKNSQLSNPFAGLLFCECGTAMSMKRYVNHGRSGDRVLYSMICNDQTYCHTKSVSYSDFLDRVISVLRDAIKDFEVKLSDDCTGATIALEAHIRALESNLNQLRKKDERQKDAYENGVYSLSDYIARNSKIQDQIRKTTAALDTAKSTPLPSVDYSGKIVKFQACIDSLLDDSVSAAEKNRFLKECIERIDYHNDMPSLPGVGRYVDNIFDLKISLRL